MLCTSLWINKHSECFWWPWYLSFRFQEEYYTTVWHSVGLLSDYRILSFINKSICSGVEVILYHCAPASLESVWNPTCAGLIMKLMHFLSCSFLLSFLLALPFCLSLMRENYHGGLHKNYHTGNKRRLNYWIPTHYLFFILEPSESLWAYMHN